MTRGLKAVLSVIIALIIALTAFIGGMLVGRYAQSPGLDIPAITASASVTSEDGLIDQVRGIISRDALKPSSDASMTTNAVRGMLESLGDKYAMYLDPKHLGYFQEETQGQFGGIGVTLSVKDGHAVIVSPLKGTPAMRAGLKAGDEIMSVDGWFKQGWTSEEVVPKIRGKEGTKVALVIRRKGVKDFPVTITRAKIDAPNITSEDLGGGVGYIRLFSFNANSLKEVTTAMRELDKKGAKGYIIDLRENPGGLLTSGIDVASLFIKDGPIVRVEYRDRPEEVDYATGKYFTAKPLVVLIDSESASAAEILGGALQDYGRAVLVGTKSYGKGSVQTVRDLANGGAVKLTVAHYLTPKSRVIDGKGLTPDILVPMDPKLQADKKTDKQLQAAITALKGKL
jgi:carboxyl-terminal processing protease